MASVFSICILTAITTIHSLSSDCNGGTCTPFTTEEKQKLLDIHNELRDRVAGGGLVSETRSHPAATDMNYLMWDDGLAAVAQAYIEQCNYAHNPNRNAQYLAKRNENGNTGTKWGPDSESNGNGIPIGENLAAYGAAYTIDKMVEHVETGWYEEWKDWAYGPTDAGCPSGQCGHYTQLVWATTRYVGCGYTNGCDDQNGMFICNYFPVGNVGSSAPYTQVSSGSPCTNCMSDRTVCSSMYTSVSYNADGSQPYNALCNGGACPTMCDGASYDRATCDGTGCTSATIDCMDGTNGKQGGRNICVGTSPPTLPTLAPPTEAPTVEGYIPECLILSDYGWDAFNGNWERVGQVEVDGRPQYKKVYGETTYLLDRIWSGYYVIHQEGSNSGYTKCGQEKLENCDENTWDGAADATMKTCAPTSNSVPTPTPTTKAPTTPPPTSAIPECLTLSNYHSGWLDGNWQRNGEIEVDGRPQYKMVNGYGTYLLDRIWSGNYVIHTPNSTSGYGTCAEVSLEDCGANKWIYWSGSAWVTDGDATMTPCAPTPPPTSPASISCVQLSNFEYSALNGQWDYIGVYNSRASYVRNGRTEYLENLLNWGNQWVLHSAPSGESGGWGSCAETNLEDCVAGKWTYWNGDSAASISLTDCTEGANGEVYDFKAIGAANELDIWIILLGIFVVLNVVCLVIACRSDKRQYTKVYMSSDTDTE